MAVPTWMAEASATRNSRASSALAMPPMPMIGRLGRARVKLGARRGRSDVAGGLSHGRPAWPGGQLNELLGKQATAPQLSTHQHRLEGAIPALSEESCIRKAVGERGLIPSPVGLADPTAEDEAATGTAFALMVIESMGKGRKPGGVPARRGVKEETAVAIQRRHAGR